MRLIVVFLATFIVAFFNAVGARKVKADGLVFLLGDFGHSKLKAIITELDPNFKTNLRKKETILDLTENRKDDFIRKLHYFKLKYDEDKMVYADMPNVKVSTFDFGEKDGFVKLPGESKPYMSILMKALEKKNMKVIPVHYDYRKSPNTMDKFFELLREKSEYETAYREGMKINFVCHGYGGLVLLNFLTNKLVNEFWKKSYVGKVILVGTPLGGTPTAIMALITGKMAGLQDERKTEPYQYNSRIMVDYYRSMTSLPYMKPQNTFLPGFTVKYGDKEYKVGEISDLFDKIVPEMSVAFSEMSEVLSEKTLTDDPEVRITRMIGTGEDIDAKFEVDSDGIFMKVETSGSEKGDGFALISKPSEMDKWKNIKDKTYNVKHEDLLTNKEVIEDIVGEIKNN